MNKLLLGALGVCTLLASCTSVTQGILVGSERHAIETPDDYFGDSTKSIVYLDQNWDGADSLWFYNTSQGSNLMRLDIFLHLEQAQSTELFRSDANMRRHRYLTQSASHDNPYGLPVGWVKDNYKDQDYIGFTCAACHTNQLNYQGTGIRIDGAPALADMETLLIELELALVSTRNNPEKLARLQKAVPRADLTQDLDQSITMLGRYNTTNAPLHSTESGQIMAHYGYGRLDAFGRIYNRVLAHLTPEDLTNFNPAGAPVSYPFLWDTPQHDFVQWNGVGNNAALGALGRNTGEVSGVFATMDLNYRDGDAGYRSSANHRNINRLERHLKKLYSPLWPETILPKIDQSLAEQGQAVFVEYRCHQCHQSIDRKDPKRRITAQMTSLELIGTDRVMADNAYSYTGKSGFFEGKYKSVLDANVAKLKGEELDQEAKFQATDSVLPMLTKATTGIIIEPDHDKSWARRGLEKAYDLIAAWGSNPVKKSERHVDFEIVDNSPEDLLAYKGRPLNGIWATAPYLHNGSVNNLYELFLPSSCTGIDTKNYGTLCRSPEFVLGQREFDPARVGFAKPQQAYDGLFNFDTSLPSNSNAGHEYAVGITPVIQLDDKGKPVRQNNGEFVLEYLPKITEAKRLALVEYLKTL